jgi:hypothetical protein
MNDDKNKQLFLQLVYSFQMQTMMMMGKLANPMTGKIERELDGAQATIDMLDMIKVKTVNNISDDESRFLEQIIADLKLNFVEEKDKKIPEETVKNSETVKADAESAKTDAEKVEEDAEAKTEKEESPDNS